MTSESSKLDTFQKIQEQHRQLASLLEQIESALTERSCPIDEVVDLIGQLGHQLTKHFQSEEAGGYFAEALYEAPRLFDRANALMLQHPKMTKSARTLAEAADPDVDPDLWWEQTAQRFEEFRAELKMHEREEDRLIQEAFTRDIGSHD
jgi:hemerythrin